MNVEVEKNQTKLNYLRTSQNSASMVRTCYIDARFRTGRGLLPSLFPVVFRKQKDKLRFFQNCFWELFYTSVKCPFPN